MTTFEQNPFGNVDIIEDPEESRCACLLLLDVSYSMSGDRIEELNRGLKKLEIELKQNSLASKRVEISVVTFGSEVDLVTDFVSARDFEAPVLDSEGSTPMCEALRIGLSKLQERKELYKSNGVTYYRPWIFLITDGGPTDGDDASWNNTRAQIQNGEASHMFSFFAVGVEGADFEFLKNLSVKPPMKLKGLSFAELFSWLSDSLKCVSASNPSDQIPLPDHSGWGSIET